MKSTGICRWLFLLISLTTWTTTTSSKEMRVVCYYTNWSVYRPGAAKFSPQNINPYLCTHLVYAFGGFTKENRLKPFDKYQDIEKGGYAKFTGLKTYNKNLKTLLAIGGWNEGSSRFSPMVANPERRKELVKNAIKFLRQNHFDGLDLDWEYPSFRDGGKPRDRDNYAQLVQELREEFDRESEKTGRPRLLLTMAVPAGIEYINKGYDIPKLTKYLDWMNILSYDYHSAFEPAVNHHAPLYSLEEDNEYNYDAELNIDYTIKHYLKLGADPDKLVLGIPTYGRSYTLFNPDANAIGAPADGPGEMGEATRENGYMAYYEICDYVKNQGWQEEQPNPDAMGPYAYKDNQWVGYDDEAIARKKSEYVAENGLGGIMFWAIDNDDFRGTCHGRPYPLIEAAKEALMEAYGLTDANLISPPSKPIKSKPRPRPKPTSKPKPVEEEAKPLKIHNRRRNRNKSKAKEEDRPSAVSRLKPRRKESRTTPTASTQASTYSSLKVTTPSYTTPAPPSTPDLDGAFKCEEDGFFQHPKDCKKYFWCLSGAGDTGITAHAFTCPAGLYFNKAADSCDYAQNVLCNKKLQKPVTAAPEKTSSSTTTTTTAAASPSTSRAPPKITAATSRTTFRQSTTTEAYEDDDYEYEDEEEEKSKEDEDSKTASEEDPKVIKELIDLIKKAGGIEELEKQLSKGGPSGKPGLDTTTQTAISKSLYERVLSKAKNSLSARKPTPTGIRNSRGPQNDGLSKAEEKPSRGKTERGKLQYTSISRNRPSTEKSVEDETDEEEEGEEVKDETAQPRRLFNKKSQPEYVTIRRPRVSSTTEASNTSGVNRNKILGEVLDDDDDEEYDDEEEEDDDDVAEDEAPKKTFSPQYVNIRRQRPSTTEASSTSKYKEIRRGTTTEATTEANDDTDGSKYKILRRGSTTSSPTTVSTEESNSSKYQLLRRGMTPTTATTPTDDSTSKYKNFRRGGTTEKPSSEPEEATSKYKQLRRGTAASTTASSSTTEGAVDTGNVVRNLTTPTDEENYVTPSLEVISGSTTATATASEPTLTTVSNSPVESSIGSSTTSTSSTTPSSTSQDPTTNSVINLVDEAATTQKESPVPATEKYPETTKSDAADATTAEARSPSISTTEPTGIDPTTIKQRPRPFSSIGRSTARPATAEPSSTTQAAKVSQSKFKLRSRPKPLHKDVVSKKAVPTTDAPNTTIKPRGRGLPRTTTERPAEERTYRPTELADFSSLTAVDFAQIKELDAAQTTHRRRRPTTTPPTTTISSNVEDEKDADKTPPPETKPGRGRRITSKKLDSIELDASATTRSGRGFGLRSTRTPTTTTESAENAIKEDSETVNVTPRGRRVVRRFRTTTKSANGIGETLNKTSTEAPAIKRGKFFTAQNRNQSSLLKTPRGSKNPLQRLFNKKPTRLPYGLQRNNVEEESDDSLEDTSTEEGENIKLSESNIRENSDVNSFDTSGKQRRKLVKLVRQKSDNLHAKNTQLPGKTTTESSKTTTTKNSEVITTTAQEAETTDAVTEQGTTTVRRGKDTESFTTIHPESTSATKTTESTENKTKPKSSLFRTRKVIRKLKPKAITTATSVENNSNRRRKLIRRRPVTVTTEDKKDEESVIASTTTTAATTTTDNATTDNATSDADNTTTTANPDADDDATATTTTPATNLRSRGINRLTTVPIESTTSAVKEETPKRLIRPFNRPKIRPYGRAPTSSTSRSTTVSGSTPEPSKESGRRVFRPRLGAIPRRTVPNRVRPPPRTTTRQTVDATEDTTVGREITTTLNYPSRRRLPKRPGFGTTTTDVFTTEPVTELTAETMPATVKNYEEPATTESGMETSTMFSETMESKDEDGNVKVVKSSTSIYNLYKPLNGEKDFDSEEDTKKNDTVDPMDKRNYVSVFRSSTTSNSFDNFDSEFDETHPHLRDDSDESYLDSAYGDDGYDTELEGGHGDGDGDDEDEDQTDEADTVDTSTEYRPARRGSSYLPIDDFAQYESMAESSSVRNRFTKPDKLPADRVTPSPKKGPKPRQKFKSITKSSNKSILKETIQIHSFNDSDPHGKMAEVVVNRFKYRTLERTTVLPDLENSSEDSSESSDEATIPIDLTTLLNLDESNESTESGEEQDDRYDSRETTEDSNEKTENYKSAETTEKYSEEVTLPNPEVSTNLNAEYRENEIIEYSTATNEISTQRQFTTTEDAPQTESNQITSTTSATVVELNDIDSTTTGSVEEVTSTAGTTIEGTTVEGSTETEVTETPTTTTPKVTTPYQRRSTLRPIESRPKFTPIRRKSSYLGTSTTEASNRSLNRFNRNRFKSTTEGADKPVKSTRNRFSYRQSSTTEKPNAIEDDDNKDEEKGDSVTENVIEDDSSVTKPLPTTTAVPLSDFIYSYTTTEAAQVKEESGKLEEQEEEKVDDKNERESSEEKGEEEKGEEETEIEKEEKEEEQEEKGEEETKVEKEEKEERQGENEEREQEKEEKQEEQKETKEEKVEEKVVKKPVRPSVNFRPRLPGSKPKVANRPPSGRRPSNSPIRSSGPYFGRSTTPRVINKPKFAKTTETPKVEEDMSGIDTEALKNRNKNLYSKKRVPNRPVTPSTTTAAAETAEPLTEIPEEITTEPGVTQDRITTATPITEAVTKPSSVETTESLTTLHHIFSAVDDDTTKNRTETTTEALSPAVTATTGKVEKLIEVSRIVKVKTKGAKSKNHNVVEEQSTSEVAPVKIGLVNRVTSIKVVGGNDTDSSLSEAAATTENAHTSIGIPAKVEEIPASEVQAKVNLTDIRVTINNIADLLHTHREDRKIDGVGDNDNRLTSGEKAQVIDGKSHINVFTPRPLFATEASTIALEGLFQTESPEQSAATPKPLNSVANDEILETENSRFVNVRVLHQDDKPTKGINDNSKFFPVKILPQDDEQLLRAEVVEVTPLYHVEPIRIVPIKVEMSKRVVDSVPVYRVGPQT